MRLTPAAPEIGFIHRKLPGGDLYFVANTANETRHVSARFRAIARHAEMWDALTGQVSGLPDPGKIDLDLEAYGSRLIYLSDEAKPAQPEPARRETVKADLSHAWQVAFGDAALSKQMETLTSWSDDAQTRYFSGRATYEKTFDLREDSASAGTRYLLDFGQGTRQSLPASPAPPDMWAYLDAPIRDAAEVYVNGKLAGVLWHPPYRVDVTEQLHTGANEIRVVVGNTAINTLAGTPQPDNRLLWDRYGMLFIPQGMENLRPLPSGMLGPVKLIQSVTAPGAEQR